MGNGLFLEGINLKQKNNLSKEEIQRILVEKINYISSLIKYSKKSGLKVKEFNISEGTEGKFACGLGEEGNIYFQDFMNGNIKFEDIPLDAFEPKYLYYGLPLLLTKENDVLGPMIDRELQRAESTDFGDVVWNSREATLHNLPVTSVGIFFNTFEDIYLGNILIKRGRAKKRGVLNLYRGMIQISGQLNMKESTMKLDQFRTLVMYYWLKKEFPDEFETEVIVDGDVQEEFDRLLPYLDEILDIQIPNKERIQKKNEVLWPIIDRLGQKDMQTLKESKMREQIEQKKEQQQEEKLEDAKKHTNENLANNFGENENGGEEDGGEGGGDGGEGGGENGGNGGEEGGGEGGGDGGDGGGGDGGEGREDGGEGREDGGEGREEGGGEGREEGGGEGREDGGEGREEDGGEGGREDGGESGGNGLQGEEEEKRRNEGGGDGGQGEEEEKRRNEGGGDGGQGEEEEKRRNEGGGNGLQGEEEEKRKNEGGGDGGQGEEEEKRRNEGGGNGGQGEEEEKRRNEGGGDGGQGEEEEKRRNEGGGDGGQGEEEEKRRNEGGGYKGNEINSWNPGIEEEIRRRLNAMTPEEMETLVEQIKKEVDNENMQEYGGDLQLLKELFGKKNGKTDSTEFDFSNEGKEQISQLENFFGQEMNQRYQGIPHELIETIGLNQRGNDLEQEEKIQEILAGIVANMGKDFDQIVEFQKEIEQLELNLGSIISEDIKERTNNAIKLVKGYIDQQEQDYEMQLTKSGFSRDEEHLYKEYLEIEKEMEKYVDQFIKELEKEIPKLKGFDLKGGYSSGRIEDMNDAGKKVRLKQWGEKLYSRTEEDESLKIDLGICLSVDNSLSMMGELYDTRRLAVFLGLLSEKWGIPFHINTFSEDLNVIKNVGDEFGTKKGNFMRELNADGGYTDMSVAVQKDLEVIKKVKKTNPDTVFLPIFITDGAANRGVTGQGLIELMKGFKGISIVAGIGINEGYLKQRYPDSKVIGMRDSSEIMTKLLESLKQFFVQNKSKIFKVITQ